MAQRHVWLFRLLGQFYLAFKGLHIVFIIQPVIEMIMLVRSQQYDFTAHCAPQAVDQVAKTLLQFVRRGIWPEDHPNLLFGQPLGVRQQEKEQVPRDHPAPIRSTHQVTVEPHFHAPQGRHTHLCGP